MLNEKGVRELAYVAEITDVKPIEGYDRVELVVVNDGWTCVVGKGQLHKGDLAVYFEIDSKLPEKPPFSDNDFIVKKKYKIKTQRMCKSISQGLIISLDELGLNASEYKKGDFLTEQLGVTYAVKEDNFRKGSSKVDKYSKMAKRNPKAAQTALWKWLWKFPNNIGKKILFVVYGKQRDKTAWPDWVKKTDEERIQNMTWILNDKEPWVVTEKIDGTSTTFTVHKRKHSKKYDFYVCSRNVVFDNDESGKCFYDENYYTKMAKRYNVCEVLTKIAEQFEYEWVTLQGETFGKGVQKREYNLQDQEFFGFNLITDRDGRWSTPSAAAIMSKYGIHWVPILSTAYVLPNTLDEILEYATAESALDHDLREGVVLRSQDGQKSFKVVSNEYLLKYH